MRTITALILCISFFFQHSALAASNSEALSACLADNTTGKDRKELARWVFLAMTAHPEIHALSAASDETRVEANKKMAALVTRLLAESCVSEIRATINNGGSSGLQEAFKSLGELAMRELMTNRSVTESFGSYTQYLDKQKLESALRAK